MIFHNERSPFGDWNMLLNNEENHTFHEGREAHCDFMKGRPGNKCLPLACLLLITQVLSNQSWEIWMSSNARKWCQKILLSKLSNADLVSCRFLYDSTAGKEIHLAERIKQVRMNLLTFRWLQIYFWGADVTQNSKLMSLPFLESAIMWHVTARASFQGS